VEGPALTSGLVAAPIQIAWGNLCAAALGQFPLMLLFPLALAVALRRRVGARYALFGVGGATFVASQVVHLPLNWALGLMGPPRGVGLLPLPWVGLIAGLSAGLCEELARYLTLRVVVKNDRGWPAALGLGAGHGGVEAMIFGSLALLGLVNVLIAPHAGSLGVPDGDQAILRHAARQYWALPWYLPLLAGWERVCAIAFHVGASVLVMRAVTRRNLGYLALAVLLHAALDAPLVYAPTIGLFWLYAFLTVAAFGMTAVTLGLREERPAGAPGAV